MDQDEIRLIAKRKIAEVQAYMQKLGVSVEAHDHINKEGFIEKVVVWKVEEKVPTPATPTAAAGGIVVNPTTEHGTAA